MTRDVARGLAQPFVGTESVSVGEVGFDTDTALGIAPTSPRAGAVTCHRARVPLRSGYWRWQGRPRRGRATRKHDEHAPREYPTGHDHRERIRPRPFTSLACSCILESRPFPGSYPAVGTDRASRRADAARLRARAECDRERHRRPRWSWPGASNPASCADPRGQCAPPIDDQSRWLRRPK